MSRSDMVTLGTVAILCAVCGLAPEQATSTTLATVLVAVLTFVRHRASVGSKELALEEVPMGTGAVVSVDDDGPDAFWVGARQLDSGKAALVCTGECPSPAMILELGRDGGSRQEVPGGGRRATFEVDGRAFSMVHRRAGAVAAGIRSGEARASLRALASLGRPSVTIGEGRMEVRLEGSANAQTREALIAFARALHRLAADTTLAQTTERGAYR